MSDAAAAISRQVLAAAKPALEDFLGRARTEFVARYRDWVQSVHCEELGEIFAAAGLARLEVLLAETPELAAEWEDTYETELARMDTLGLDLLVVGKAESRKFMKDEARMVLSCVPVVAGVVTKVAIGVALPGVGAIVGAPAGAGVEWLLERVLR